MELPKIATNLTFNHLDYPGEVNTLPSDTIPDMTMSIQEILKRYGSGVAEDFTDLEETEPDVYMPNPETMDFADREAYADAINAELQQNQADRLAAEAAENQQQNA